MKYQVLVAGIVFIVVFKYFYCWPVAIFCISRCWNKNKLKRLFLRLERGTALVGSEPFSLPIARGFYISEKLKPRGHETVYIFYIKYILYSRNFEKSISWCQQEILGAELSRRRFEQVNTGWVRCFNARFFIYKKTIFLSEPQFS